MVSQGHDELTFKPMAFTGDSFICRTVMSRHPRTEGKHCVKSSTSGMSIVFIHVDSFSKKGLIFFCVGTTKLTQYVLIYVTKHNHTFMYTFTHIAKSQIVKINFRRSQNIPPYKTVGIVAADALVILGSTASASNGVVEPHRNSLAP